jgi:hypothetical protein
MRQTAVIAVTDPSAITLSALQDGIPLPVGYSLNSTNAKANRRH